MKPDHPANPNPFPSSSESGSRATPDPSLPSSPLAEGAISGPASSDIGGASGSPSNPSGNRAKLEQKTHEVTETVKEKARTAARNLKDQGEEYAEGRKDRAADRVDRYGGKIDDMASSFEAEDPNIAWITHQAADRLSAFANSLRSRDLRGLWRDAEGLARRHPVAFVGGMFAAGVALGSVVRSARNDLGGDGEDYEDQAEYARDEFRGASLSPDEQLARSPGVTSGDEFY